MEWTEKLRNLIRTGSTENIYSEKMYAPFAEKKNNVVQFELTEGCSHNQCSFCNMYSMPYKEKSTEEGASHIRRVFRSMPKEKLSELERSFIANGDALNMDALKLNELIQYSIYQFKKYTGKLPRRTALFASTKNILSHSKEELAVLACGGTCDSYLGLDNTCSLKRFRAKKGLDLVYWGVESGSSDVLHYLKKGCNQENIIEANSRLRFAKIRKSVMIMPGAGGIKYANSHLEDTIKILNKIKPEFITLIGIDPAPNTLYAKRMKEEQARGENRPLTKKEIAIQTLDIIEKLEFETKLGCFDKSKQTFGTNPFPFGSFKTSEWNAQKVVNFANKQREKLEELL